jgi:multidrug resistance protein, MATE family
LPWQQEPMGAAGFWLALIVGLTIAALGLVVLLRRTAHRA